MPKRNKIFQLLFSNMNIDKNRKGIKLIEIILSSNKKRNFIIVKLSK